MEAPHPFQQWVDSARPRHQIWRTLVGGIIIVAAWMIWTAVLLLIAIGMGLIDGDAIAALIGESERQFSYLDTVVMLLVMLATFWGIWFGVWAALKLVHKRELSTTIAYNDAFNLHQFGVGGALAAAYLAFSLGWSVVAGHGPHRSELDIGAWLMALGPLCIFIFFQTAGEELLFRGYLPQQLAARFRHPMVWGLLPTLVFGVSHAGNAGGNIEYAMYYVAAASLLGMVMMAMVWRTGSLAAAMGFHFINNVVAFTVAGPDTGSSSLTLYAWSTEDLVRGSASDLLLLGILLAFVLSPWAPLPKGQPLRKT